MYLIEDIIFSLKRFTYKCEQYETAIHDKELYSGTLTDVSKEQATFLLKHNARRILQQYEELQNQIKEITPELEAWSKN